VTAISAKSLYEPLKRIGLSKRQIHSLLPEWWDDSAAKSQDGLYELALMISRRLSIDAAKLLHGEIAPLGAVSHLAYKHSGAVDSADLQAATHIASSLSQAIVASSPMPLKSFTQTPDAIREAIARDNQGQTDFIGLLKFCWAMGIPVVPLPNLPTGVRKMDGAVLMIEQRPVIVISRKNDSRSWLSFILAHELAHYCLGHLEQNSAIVDISLKTQATYAAESSADLQEADADQFALQLLGGKEAEAIMHQWSTRASAVELAVNATDASSTTGIAAGHFILRYAFLNKRWPEAMEAQRFLQDEFDAQSLLVTALASHIRLDAIAEDLRELVTQVTGIR
jgi:Zn-dependent peptidase ImmA (M78 family)